MSLPSSVFLDTSVYAGQQYNFESTALSTFVPVAKRHALRVLLPDPTEREIVRHIRERSQDALQALDEARRRAPFLSKWKHFPPARRSSSVTDWEVLRIAMDEWRAFQKQLSVVKLDYSGVDLKQVMTWYDQVTPPFREGKKRKEFPDAFAVAIVEAFAQKHDCVVAVVSDDQDFKLACDRFSNLLYFASLPKLTELLLAEPGEIERLRLAITADLTPLERALFSEAAETEYLHEDDAYRVVRSKVQAVELDEVTVVALGAGECTLTFDATFEAEHLLRWTEWDHDHDEVDECEEWVLETSHFSGTAKVALEPLTDRVREVLSLVTNVWEVYVSENPRDRW